MALKFGSEDWIWGFLFARVRYEINTILCELKDKCVISGETMKTSISGTNHASD